jgi:hypothetical protein
MENLQQFAYLLDNDNYMVENKIFIDLMWHIAKEKMTSTDTKGRSFITAKSYVIRNAGVMFQQIFYWHFNAIKQGKATKYQYKGENTVKMDFEDWWNSCRLTDKEVSTANKFLIDAGLIEIQKMRIKQKDSDVFKPSNCYLINTIELEKYLVNIVDINKSMYEDKVIKVREENIRTSLKSKESTDSSTDDSVTSVTGGTCEINGLDGDENNSSTISTDENQENVSENSPVTPVTGVTVVTPVTGVTVVTPLTDVTNKSNTSFADTSCTDRSEEESTPLSYSILLENLKSKLTDTSFKTWFENGIKEFSILDNKILIVAASSFTKDILENRYLEIINESICEITRYNYTIEFKS